MKRHPSKKKDFDKIHVERCVAEGSQAVRKAQMTFITILNESKNLYLIN